MSYQNPVPVIDGPSFYGTDLFSNPDPYVLKFQGRYYCYSSGPSGVNVLRSDDLQSFCHCGRAYESDWEKSFWAPAVLYWNGRFYLYYSSLEKEETDDHLHFLRAASSESPLGPFTYEKTLIRDFAIDPHVVRSDGKLFLFYAQNDMVGEKTGRIGTVIAMDRMNSPTRLCGNPRVVLWPTIDEEIFAKNRFGDGRDWHTLEGPFYLERGGMRYLMYSGSAYTNEDYFVGYATASMEAPLETAEFVKHPGESVYAPLIRKTGRVEGTGHNSVVKAPDNVTDAVVYHGRLRSGTIAEEQDGRKIFVDLLRCENGVLKTEAPTASPQPDLPRPAFRDVFSPEAASWQAGQDAWKRKNRRLTGRGTGTAYPDMPLQEDCYLEVWAAVGDGLFGVVMEDARPDGGLRIGVRKEWDTVYFRGSSSGQCRETTFPIERRYLPGCFHKLALCRNGAACKIYLDDEEACEFQWEAGPKRLGLFIENGTSEAASFELTSLKPLVCRKGGDGGNP